MFKRLRRWYVKQYEHLQQWLAKHDPAPMQHANDPITEVDWKPASAQHCPECTWKWMLWDAFNEQWQCSHCGIKRYPSLIVTEKRQVVVPVAIVRPILEQRQIITLPEQRAVQPPRIQAHRQTEKFAPREAQVFKKYLSGEIILVDGKPRYKNGVPVHTDQFERLRIPTHDDHRRTG